MINGLEPYPEYQKSDLPWLGKIPAHWRGEPGFAAFREKKVRNIGGRESTVLSLSYGRIVIKPVEKLHGLVPDSFETYQLVEPGDIIVRSTDLQNDWTSLRVGFVRDHGIITSAYLCLRTTESVLPEYGYLLLHAFDLMKVFYGMGSGLRQNLDFRDLKRMLVFIPPHPEQAAIVRFVDHASGRVERAIRAKKKLIALLNEQKQAIINRAVTRGLDPTVPLRPSGIPWLGDIPQHWKPRRIKFLTTAVGGMTPSKGVERFWNGQIPWVTPKDMKVREITDSQDRITTVALQRTNITLIRPPAVLIVVRGMILARTFPTAVTAVPVTVNQDMKALLPKPELNADYFVSLLTGIQRELLSLVEEAGHGTRCLRTDSWANFSLPLPPTAEQTAISAFLKTELGTANHLIHRTEREISLLNEYRTRLIADVVTGKLDVRGSARRLPVEVEELSAPIPTEDLIDEAELEPSASV